MWRLKNTENDFGLLCNRNLVIGRKDADIVISGDSSVSRKHATIKVTHVLEKIKNSDLVPTIEVEDSSKFGTFVTHSGLKQKVAGKVKLYHGDSVQFGAQHSIYSLTYTPLVVTSSMLDNEMKSKLQESLLKLGGHMVNNWLEKVTHIIVKEIKLSVKVAQALVNGCHIVTPQYIFELEKQCQANIDPEPFLPALGEPNLSAKTSSFKVNPQRKSVFRNHTFVYLCKQQMKRLGSTIICGGGKTFMVDDPEVNDEFLAHPKVCVILSNSSEEKTENKMHERVKKVLLRNGRRFIQEHEIGLAILYCDLSVYCNPDFDLNSQNTFTQQKSTTEDIKVETVDLTQDGLHSTSSMTTRKRQRGGESGTDDTEKPIEPDNRRLYKKQKKVPPKVIEKMEPTESSSKGIQLNSLASDPGSAMEEVPDSCLADDSLWSQNLDSQVSKSRRVSEMESSMNIIPPTCPSQENEDVNLARGKNIKREQQTPCKNSNFPTAEKPHPPNIKIENPSPRLERNKEPIVTDMHIKSESQPIDKENEDFANYVPNVDVVSLIFAKKRSVVDATPQYTNAKMNFKRFQKVWPIYMKMHGIQSDSVSSHPVIPRIIGGSDLFEHHNDTQKSRDIFAWVKEDARTLGSLDDSQDTPNPFSNI